MGFWWVCGDRSTSGVVVGGGCWVVGYNVCLMQKIKKIKK
jgi:hypothetical protein